MRRRKKIQKMQTFIVLGVLHHLTAKCHLKFLLWCTQSKAFLCNKNQQKSKMKMLWEKKIARPRFSKTFDVFFVQNFIFGWWFWFLNQRHYFVTSTAFQAWLFFPTLNKTDHQLKTFFLKNFNDFLVSDN